MHLCALVLLCAWAAKFYFQFCCVYPADSLQSVDNEAAMTARASVAKLHRGLTEKLKLMAVSSEQLFIGPLIYKGRMAGNKSVCSDQICLLVKTTNIAILLQ